MSSNNLRRTHEYEIWMFPISASNVKRKSLEEYRKLYIEYCNNPDSINTANLYEYVAIQQVAPPKTFPSFREQKLFKIRLQRMLYDIIKL